ncbi:hypothetical protein E2C01_069828 [Portunus trituberculatus]|uniref:Uncharacterized protein n=1 Tax=Portunus trituberculatus TaxID=210409 RepID=A0A5B7HR37_PORTR|nr:hypothetical protein [Portunus trituberculatus]
MFVHTEGPATTNTDLSWLRCRFRSRLLEPGPPGAHWNCWGDTSTQGAKQHCFLDQQQKTSLPGVACERLAWNVIAVRRTFPEFLTSLN